jgi:c-di-GMP-binding flagellar brake protein YcgR
MEGTGAERRKYHRIAMDQVISFSELDRPARQAVTKNVSSGGISFEAVGLEINLGDRLRVTFNVEDQALVAIGRVVWATDTDLLTQEVGIAFDEIDPEDARRLEEALEPALEPVGLYDSTLYG